jgi:glycosyltransferase involved in cell wall biosynthesis
VPDGKIFPFSYFPVRSVESQDEVVSTPRFKIAHIGQAIHRKGGDILIDALSRIKDLDWECHIVGDGASLSSWKSSAEVAGIQSRTMFHGKLANADAMNVLADSDLYVLTSRFDGWGAVTNEALLLGVPVIASDRCGSQDLLKSSWRGSVYSASEPEALAKAIREWIGKGKRTPALTKRISEWSSCIESQSAGIYIDQVIRHYYSGGTKPTVPWFVD